MSQTRVKYTGSTPGADANTYNLFSTVNTGIPRGWFQLAGIERAFLTLNNAGTCTVKDYYSDDGGTTWIPRSSTAVAVPAAGAVSEIDFVVEGFRDWKVDLVNGGSAQTGLAPQISLSTDRAPVI